MIVRVLIRWENCTIQSLEKLVQIETIIFRRFQNVRVGRQSSWLKHRSPTSCACSKHAKDLKPVFLPDAFSERIQAEKDTSSSLFIIFVQKLLGNVGKDRCRTETQGLHKEDGNSFKTSVVWWYFVNTAWGQTRKIRLVLRLCVHSCQIGGRPPFPLRAKMAKRSLSGNLVFWFLKKGHRTKTKSVVAKLPIECCVRWTKERRRSVSKHFGVFQNIRKTSVIEMLFCSCLCSVWIYFASWALRVQQLEGFIFCLCKRVSFCSTFPFN